jgi:2-keto-4-pentenoate hydratase/2-oxohepta-3-ene-1,7-dioic acid hydratase in catechol pathway
MRLLSYRTADGYRAGLRAGDIIIDLQKALAAHGIDIQTGMRSFLSREDWRDAARLASNRYPPSITLPYSRDLVGPVVPDPQKIIFVGGNTNSHMAEAAKFTKATPPRRPMVISKTINAINGPYDPIVQPAATSKLDYEAELCVIVGTRSRRVTESNVKHIIAGYTVSNDVSDREYQLSEWEDSGFYRTHFLGKSFDGFAPCGPEMVTPDEFGELGPQMVTCQVNGVLKQNGPLSDLYFSVEQVFSHLSIGQTLEPGDMLLMGSPAGVAYFAEPQCWAKPGDAVRCIYGMSGYIENRIVKDEAAPFAPK